VIDIHTHLLPGVDDGSTSIEASIPVLDRFAAEGVEVVVCTPHLRASEARAAPRASNEDLLSALAAAAPNGPRLELGWEIMLDEPGANLAAPGLSLGSSRAVLVEFSRTSPPGNGAAELFRLRMSGVVPVLAHPERYWGCTVNHVREWKRCGAVIQMDAVTLLGRSPLSTLAHELVAEGLVDCMASDNHADGRSLAMARTWLSEVGETGQAELLTRENARRLLADEPVVDVPPLARRKGVFSILRELVARSRKGSENS
jgi:protein-tyrosine phosphatase